MWTTWSGGQSCLPVTVERPQSAEAVARAVERAAEAGRVVRAVGAGHSFSDIALTDGTLLRLDALNRVLDVDAAAGLVTVEAGITLHALSRALLAHGLALPNLGDIDVQSLAGALATGTHGTGARLPNLSAAVAAMELVTGDGTRRTLTEADGDLLRAARVGLGALGIVVAVTLRCVPAFRLHALDEPRPLSALLDRLDALADTHDHFEFWTFPHTDVALTRINTRTDADRAPLGRVRETVGEVWLDNHVFDALNRIARRAPRTIPLLTRAMGAAASRRERVDWSFKVFASPRLVRFEEMEYAVPRERAREALVATKAVIERHPISFPIELRFVAADDALLSPAHGRDTAYLAVHAYQGMPFEPAFREVEALMADFDGRPHWGKRSFLTAAELAGRHPRWDAFQDARRALDPDGRFANAHARRVLGAQQDPRSADVTPV